MLRRKALVLTAIAFGLLILAVPVFAGETYRVLQRFHYPGATVPGGGVIIDSAGNLYGATCGDYYQPGHGYGAAFMLSPGAAGSWSETVLHNFGDDCPTDGLVFDKAGNLYGSTFFGGKYQYGTVFELTRNSDGSWSETVLHEFGRGKDGKSPNGDLIFDAKGNLYGTTYFGGTGTICQNIETGCGTVFELTPGRSGRWTETVLHNFHSYDGVWPTAGLVMDAAGHLYGPTAFASTNQGTIFELSPAANGKWRENTVFAFNGKNGSWPAAKLVFDANGNLYGTSQYGNYAGGVGNVFELARQQNGQWTEKIIRNFYRERAPYGPVLLDTTGNLYVTTTEGGHHARGGLCRGGSCGGSIFKLSPGANGDWTATVLHDFGANRDGLTPTGDLAMDAAGNIYGTTQYGGNSETCDDQSSEVEGCGTIYELTP